MIKDYEKPINKTNNIQAQIVYQEQKKQFFGLEFTKGNFSINVLSKACRSFLKRAICSTTLVIERSKALRGSGSIKRLVSSKIVYKKFIIVHTMQRLHELSKYFIQKNLKKCYVCSLKI